MAAKLSIPPAIQRRAVRRLDAIANDPNSPVHSATTAARTLLARANREPDDDGRPENRPPLILLPANDRDRAIDDATRKRIRAGDFITVIPLYNDREPGYEAKNEELVAAITATLDAAYPEVERDRDDPEAAQLVDDERRRKARDKKRRQRAAAAAEVEAPLSASQGGLTSNRS